MIFLLSLLFPLFSIIGARFGGYTVCLATLLFFPVIPILDALCDRFEISFNTQASKKQTFLVVLCWAVLYPLSVWMGVDFVSQVGILSLQGMGLTLSIGLSGSIAIVAAHDLIHKHSKIMRTLGQLILLHVGYMHFGILHRLGHHKYVGTKLDHSTAWFNETVYRYLIRTIKDCYLACWRMEEKKLKSKGLFLGIFYNPVTWFTFIPGALFAFFWITTGIDGAMFFFMQATIAVITLETVSYIQHYGLLRREVAPGTYETLQAKHSWDSYKVFSNIFFMNIQIHASHHKNASKWFDKLERSCEAQQLPFGYPIMIQMAFVPSLWKRVIHPILDEGKSQDRFPIPVERDLLDSMD